ncbi:response regulator [Edaphobacter albus]|uniref:response regulator n=1 Tax=Edaphobacter sp. 4G125 TaxID=2763071 RepID=UPI0016486F85|nr:response regulator [Edaphobacter sp. 4G125]QNI35318.1 response regulator [Edaphobacter sp. 4G125]
MQKTILLVDDNAIQATVRQAILKRHEYTVITALNPSRALEQLRYGDFLTEIHLVITDHIMPGMTGSTFVRAVRDLHPQIPILVISGLEEAVAEYKDLNIEFRVKPLPPEQLLECVRNLAGPSDPASEPILSHPAPAVA